VFSVTCKPILYITSYLVVFFVSQWFSQFLKDFFEMSKDNTIIILQTPNNFYVVNTTNAEDLTYEPDVVPVGKTEPYFSRDFVVKRFKGPIPYAGVVSSYYNCYKCSTKEQAFEVAEKMEEMEEDEIGWGPEYGIDFVENIYPEEIE